ncbi:Glycosyl hydrolase family 20, catalytic domain [Deinococcus reticulitermitis]|uniref:Glycosyl hydrolase family 20, catalytic domain n=1 Tax=Deinococcus reticulitermitis TaxID=856736 RepID=A0A1H6SP28_9DEIO|nr:glycoside hydrolase family 20 zincin-like fold domain-containing protein [Deinococcus reticulitermitis]SEI69678.1 Glycosyl hydrolase family 20, catalytic domain [Deinococcus reticulitermitis]
MKRVNFRPVPLAALLAGALLLGASVGAQAAPLPTLPAPRAKALTAPAQPLPQPRQASYPAGTLPLAGLALRVVGTAPELTWAARDLKAEWQTRLGQALPDAPGSAGRLITVGTLADSGLAARVRAAGLKAEGAEGYALLVDATGAAVVGAAPRGAYLGVQTLRQLLTPQGVRFARISDAPALADRIAMIYLDQYSQGINDRLIPMLAALKYNQVLIMSNYVQWDTARAGGFAHPGGASKAEARRVAELARSYGLEPIPLIETLGHVGWMFYGGKNTELRQDPDAQESWAYDTLNPATYDRVLFPILKEAVEVFRPRVVHIGHDEVRAAGRGRFPARPNGVALGFEKLFVDDTVKLHGFLKAQNVGTMIWHDTAFADSLIATLPAQLPKDIQVAYWNYTPGTGTEMLGRIKALGFPVLGASFKDPGNPETLAKAAAQVGGGMIQTRWNGYFGNPSIWDGMAEQGVAYVRAGNAFWNPQAPVRADAPALYRDLYQPGSYHPVAGFTVSLKAAATRTLSDPGGEGGAGPGWIGKGPDTDLRALGQGVRQVGPYTFDLSGAVMVRGSRSAVSGLPERVTLDLGERKAGALAFLHVTGWPGNDRQTVGRYEIVYADGRRLTQPLEYGRHIRAWTEPFGAPGLEKFSMIAHPAWSGVTRDGLEVGATVLEWTNPRPEVAIRSVTLVSEGGSANPALLGLTLLGGQ